MCHSPCMEVRGQHGGGEACLSFAVWDKTLTQVFSLGGKCSSALSHLTVPIVTMLVTDGNHKA